MVSCIIAMRVRCKIPEVMGKSSVLMFICGEVFFVHYYVGNLASEK